VKASELKPGRAVEIDNTLFVVVRVDHVKPGKGGAFAATKLKNVKTGQNVEKRFRSVDEVTGVNLDKREMEYLYSDGSGAVFMDNETFEQITIGEGLLGDALLYIKPNNTVTGLFHQRNPISIELPAVVDLVITDTTPQVKGATATNQLKEAQCETGLKTRVPPFIETGELVRISTEDGSYVSRVSE